jgi:hypothetical protein
MSSTLDQAVSAINMRQVMHGTAQARILGQGAAGVEVSVADIVKAMPASVPSPKPDHCGMYT